MAKLIWEWKSRFVVVLVVRGLLIVTSHTSYEVTSCPVVMRRYANVNGDEQRYKMSKTQVFLAFYKMVIMVEWKLTNYRVCAVVVGTAIQHSSRWCSHATADTTRAVYQIAVPTTPSQTISWSIPITNDRYFDSSRMLWWELVCWKCNYSVVGHISYAMHSATQNVWHINSYQHIVAGAKWLTFCRQHFRNYFLLM